MAGIRLEFAQFGHFDSFDVIRSITSMVGVADVDLPAPIATGVKTMYYVDNMVTKGAIYYYKVRVWRGDESFVSNEVSALVGLVWTPENGTAKMLLIADDLTSSAVSAWKCRKTGVEFTQSNAAYQPNLSDIGGQKAVYFNGTAKMLETTNAAITGILNNKSNAWYFVVTKKDNSLAISGGSLLVNFTLGTSASGRLNLLAGDSAANLNKYNFGGRRLDSASASDLLTSVANSNSGSADIVAGSANYSLPKFKFHINGAFDSEFTPVNSGVGNISATNSQYVRISATTSYAVKGWIACVIVGNTELTENERQKLEGWAAHKYGLVDKLPVGHPYKNLIPTQD